MKEARKEGNDGMKRRNHLSFLYLPCRRLRKGGAECPTVELGTCGDDGRERERGERRRRREREREGRERERINE